MRSVGSVIIGLLTGITIPIYDFSTMKFSLVNLLILVGLVALWHYVYDMLSNKKEV